MVKTKALLLSPGKVCQRINRAYRPSDTIPVPVVNVGVVCACFGMRVYARVRCGLSVQGVPESDIRNHSSPCSLRQGLSAQPTAHQYGLSVTQLALGSPRLCLLSLKL